MSGRHRRPAHERRVVPVGQAHREAGWHGGPQSPGDAFVNSRDYRAEFVGGRHRLPGTPDVEALTSPSLQVAARKVNEALGRAVVQLGQEAAVYVFGGPSGRAAVDAEWRRREAAARERR